ncbi:MAG: bifunctional UDP-N-acetylmuramoyl-tripeptide:D-alanyl-D-alanine ligase/alanine racemase [Paludibacteraceae bacterium]|nr:bifunctional UDP-N-acetylmuramoyl-tripeptide:D-alanyl-D-alanine ligase/alanine racemase [Paludibacteraceae bacterium]
MYTIKQIAEMVGGKFQGNCAAEINRLLTDSRALSFPEDTLFIALKSNRNDGHKFIGTLYKKGVRSFLVNKVLPEFQNLEGANFIEVDDTLLALQTLSAKHRHSFNIPVIGITGSNGKTIVKEWLYQLLNEDYKITRSPRSYNSQIGVPLSVWDLNSETQLGIFEAGISQMGEMERLQPIVAPTIGIFTNLGDAHQENFSSMKVKCAEKLKLFLQSDTVIFNKDNKLVDITAAQSGTKAKFFTFGTNKEADVHILAVNRKSDRWSSISYQFAGKDYTYEIPFIDDASIENSLSCLCAMLVLGVSVEKANAKLSAIEPIAMRLEVKDGQNGCLVINDSYNSDITSLSIALDFLTQQATAKERKKTLILSDIKQNGQDPKLLYENIASLVEGKGIDRLIGIGEDISLFQSLFNVENQVFYPNTDTFLSHMNICDFTSEAILLKGSRKFRFEEISDRLSSAVHETVLEVDLGALVNNFNYFRSFLKPGTKIMSMVKANAYGSGDVEVARTLQHNGCDYLAVAVADEGAVLRREGIHIPIVVMNPEQNSFAKIFEYNLEPEVYSFGLLDRMIKEAAQMGIKDYPIHVKIDTGMHRLGFEEKDIDALIEKLKHQDSVKIRSVFSHLVGSDDAKFDAFTEQQIAIFSRVKERLEKAFPHKIIAHILNSAGIERFSQYQFDMVRLGIGHYGMSAVDNRRLEEVCTLKTNILQIRRVPATDTVGYSRKGTLNRDSVIGAIPIGYADGWNRKLGNRVGKVLVNGKFAPIVGNICMDVCMIDLTDIDAKEGDTVVLFGKGHPIQGVADTLGTISYEILAGLTKRVKRVYLL